MKDNILKWVELAQPEDWYEGGQAFLRYHQVMHDFAQHYNCGFVQTVEAFVALSPNSDYHGNIRSLAGVLNYCNIGGPRPVVSTYNTCRDRAISYVDGSVSFSDKVRGEKIKSFRDNILYPETSKRVTIDGHIICIVTGSELTMKEASFLLKSHKQYYEYESIFRSIALGLKLIPSALQATLWVTRKRVLGIKYSSQLDLFRVGDLSNILVSPEKYLPYPITTETN